MRGTHERLESIWERLVRAVEEGWKRPSKSSKGFKLRRTSNSTFSKTGLKLHTKKTVIAFVPENHRIRDKYVQKYFNTFRINQITFTYSERKKERPIFYGMFSQNLPISATFIAILKITLTQFKTIGVRTPQLCKRCEIFGGTNQDVPCKKANFFVLLCISYLRPTEFAASLSGKKNSCSVIASGFLHRPSSYYACLKIVSYWIFLFIIAKV